MALTESQQLTVAQIVQVPVTQVEYQISLLGDTYATADWETAVEAQLTRWTTAGVDFVSIEPKEKNFGAKINPENEKNDIRSNLAILFQRSDWANAAGTVRTVRG